MSRAPSWRQPGGPRLPPGISAFDRKSAMSSVVPMAPEILGTDDFHHLRGTPRSTQPCGQTSRCHSRALVQIELIQRLAKIARRSSRLVFAWRRFRSTSSSLSGVTTPQNRHLFSLLAHGVFSMSPGPWLLSRRSSSFAQGELWRRFQSSAAARDSRTHATRPPLRPEL